VDSYCLEVYQLYEQDAVKRIADFNRELNTRQGNLKTRSIKLRELRTVTLLKKEHLVEPLQKCKSYADML
jgi:hypothetical protein